MNAFDKVIGYETIKQELFQICDMIHNPDIYEELTTSVCGCTVSVVSRRGLQTIREQKCIYFMLADSTFQKNCKRFGIKRIIAIDAKTGQQEEFYTHNLS
jgi:hypothetical protein